MKRLSTLTFGRRVAQQIDNGAKLAEALELAMVVDILATMDAHNAARFFVLAPFQTFKSLIGQLRLLRNHLVRARPALWYAPTDDFAKDFADTKLNLLLDNLPALRALHHDDKTKSSKLRRILTGGASHLILSAKTENDRHGKTACDLYLDEVHLYEPGWIDQISNRRGAYPDEFTETFLSTGLTAGTDAAKLWATTDLRTWYTRCPHCKKLFEPRYLHREKDDDPESPIIGGLLYEKRFLANGLPDETAIAATLAYQCPRCRTARLSDSHGSRVSLSGTAAHPRGLYLCRNESPSPLRFGWTVHGIAIRPWLPIVMRFERAQLARQRGDLEPLGTCIREEFAGIWTVHEHLSEKKLRPPGGYRMGDLERWSRLDPALRAAALRLWWEALGFDPDAKPYLIATVDVQQDWFRLVIRAWNRHSQSRLLYTDTITTPGRIAELCDLFGVLRFRTVLDRRHRPGYVRMLCAQFGWRSLMGEADKDYLHPDGIRRIISQSAPLDPFLGTAHQGTALIFEHNFAKWSALDRFTLLRTLSANDGTPLFTAADDAPEWYFKEIDAYHRIPKFKGVTKEQRAAGYRGDEFHEWQASGPDHSADCECMQIAVASALNLTGAESIETPQPPP